VEVKGVQINGDHYTVVFVIDGKLVKAKVIKCIREGSSVYEVLLVHEGTVVTVTQGKQMAAMVAKLPVPVVFVTSEHGQPVCDTANVLPPLQAQLPLAVAAAPVESYFKPARCLVDKAPVLGEHDLVLKSPLAGLVVKIKVAVGQFVVKNQPVVVIESMKMENEICAPFPAFIKTLSISEGNLVKPNQVIVIFEKRGGSGDAATKRFNDQEVFER